MDFTTNDGIRLHYYDTNEAKPVIVAIPGIGGSSQMWLEVMELFKDDFRFIILDPRNQGRSQRTYKGQRISRHAKDLAELFQKLDLHDVIAIGNSMGAATLWSYLSLYGSSRLRAIVDLDQPPKMIHDQTWQYGFKELSWNNYPQYLKIDFGNAFYTHIDDQMFTKAKQEAKEYPYCAEDNYLCLIDHAEQDWRDVLMDMTMPMLVLAGKNSPFFDYHFAFAMQKLNSRIKIQVIKNCGHLIQAEQPLAMYQAIINFLKDVTQWTKS
ncbi:alpha/beta hydrolase [Lactobacillus sp. ESL0677]|uniref:alpha/beta fold hydrolase n=1 Tax=Lactobacillus sp. ESL0677 TaxID=2983208 RepID=UPI0023F87858|nr:alpha/beta hydrolase [Lactobacillus sp. ESL0677]WEV36159.1 alpha/beta hydrolase [Lactobacillus sp. ESL0677]